MKKQRFYSLERRRSIAAYAFIGLWLAGFLFFFAEPIIATLRYSFTELTTKADGGMELLPLEAGAFGNYVEAVASDPNFVPYLVTGLKDMLLKVPTIVMFSIFIAIILNQNFRGRVFMRGIFFLPVIVTTGMISSIIRDNLNNVAQGGGEASSNIFQSSVMLQMLQDANLPDAIVNTLTSLINTSVDTVWSSGVQILIFLSAILAIPDSYYEVASVEGATGWESFWKITFPVIKPYIFVNVIYSVIDIFSNYDNDTMQYIIDTIYSRGEFSLGSAMAWIYLLIILLIIGIVTLLLKPRKERC